MFVCVCVCESKQNTNLHRLWGYLALLSSPGMFPWTLKLHKLFLCSFSFYIVIFPRAWGGISDNPRKASFAKPQWNKPLFYRICRSHDVLTWHAAVCGDGGGDGHISSSIWNFLQAEMRKKGFQKPWQILGSRYSQTDASNGACGILMTASCSCCSWNKPAKNLQHPCLLEKLDPTAENALYVASQRSVKTVTSLLCCAGFAQTCDGTLASSRCCSVCIRAK